MSRKCYILVLSLTIVTTVKIQVCLLSSFKINFSIICGIFAYSQIQLHAV